MKANSFKLFRGLSSVQKNSLQSIVTIGNFDGLHRGHQRLLENISKRAAELDCQSVVLSFEPLPREYFMGAKAPARLSNLRQKISLMQSMGVDAFYLLNFNQKLSQMEAEDFVTKILINGLHTKELLVGEDFQFGKQRKGNIQVLRQYNEFSTATMLDFCINGVRVSSTLVRKRLAESKFDDVAKLLGRRFTMDGKVRHGQKLGRKLGFPTINIWPQRHKAPIEGIFAVWVHGIVDGRAWPGVASLGRRPAVMTAGDEILEVYLLDFQGDLYGRYVQVEFVEKIRDEMNFEQMDHLIQQIEDDTNAARTILENCLVPEYV